MANNINSLVNKLFETLEKMEKDEIDPAQAKAIVEVSQTILNAGKLQLESLKLMRNPESDFLGIQKENALPPQKKNSIRSLGERASNEL